MYTHIDDAKLIPLILELGWQVKNNTWTDMPQRAYDSFKEHQERFLK